MLGGLWNQVLSGFFQEGNDLLMLDGRETVQEDINRLDAFKVLNEDLGGDAGPCKDRRAPKNVR